MQKMVSSRIPGQKDFRSATKNSSIFLPKKLFLSSRNYDLGYSSQTPDSDLDFVPIPVPEVKKHRIPDPQHCAVCKAI
jgi:hypothetical protein